MTRSRLRRFLSTIVACALLAAGWLLLAPRQIGGAVTYVTTVGASMEPRVGAGDLVLVRTKDTYSAGDVVAYRSDTVDTTVLHRIVERDGDRFILQGDNNTFLDPDRPLASDLLGQEWVRIPGGGRVIGWATNPLHGGLLTGFGVLVASTIGSLRRRRRRVGPIARTPSPGLAALSHAAASVRMSLAVTAVAVATVGAIAYTRPLTTTGPVTYRHAGQFDYNAPAPDSPAYQNGRVNGGDPLFLRVVTAVDLSFAYNLHTERTHDTSGRAALAVELANSNGWRRTIELRTTKDFDGDHVTVTGRLDVARMQALIDEVEAATGTTGGAYTLTVVPTVELLGTISGTAIDDTFSPRLAFQLDRLQLRPAATGDSGSGPAALEAEEARTLDVPDAQPARLSALGRTIDVDDARRIALFGVPALLAAALAAAILARRATAPSPTTGATLAARHQRNLVKVDSFHQAPDRTTVDLASIDALAHLAERYDQPILQVTRSDGASDYIIENDRTVYCYRTGRDDSDEPWYVEAPRGLRRPRLVPTEATLRSPAPSRRAGDRRVATTLTNLLRAGRGA